jgi:hypothetical protein
MADPRATATFSVLVSQHPKLLVESFLSRGNYRGSKLTKYHKTVRKLPLLMKDENN